MPDDSLVLDAVRQIRRADHLLLDTGLLVVLIIGGVDRSLLPGKRVEAYIPEDFDLLAALVRQARSQLQSRALGSVEPLKR